MDRFRAHRGMDETDLAHFLGCVPKLLSKVALCRRPDPGSPTFRADIHRIADAFGLQADRLVQLIREVDVLETLEDAAPTAEQAESRGLLLAARDIEPGEDVTEETADEAGNETEEES
ncbi:MAG: hypothetical protein HY683_01455 [Chloroflexi bacterium]|nr:hypothetical protein [Chloroflexota bacterium]